ncbi:hypothetical protein L2E82_00862 [Cichorium intybus]|uniref:Uncharacterized protein n=1 Tax=Cichorium intybus TaxID=13427 RepID=A0ACB9GXD4_CICIN|nr:hypothetical protein L2E82_00862 [Cichorium intybus]
MNPPAAVSVESKPETTNDPKANPKTYECGLCDIEVVYKIAQELLPGLASACVDNTTGGIFKNAGSVAVDMRKEMTDYLSQRSETYVAEFLLSEKTPVLEVSEHPFDIIIILIDDFAASKINMFSRVSEWVSSDRREDRIDDFVQEIDVNGFWSLARRESLASMLLKNVDYKNSFHCNMVCGSEEELAKHRSECKFRPMDCVHEGCSTRYCAAQKENHEAICPFMVLPCEQKCSDNYVTRREMDRHCVTICPMKLVNCAFYTVGCKSCIPICNVQQHNMDELSDHLFLIIRTAHKEAKEDDLKHRVEQIRSQSNTEKLARARDARALTYLIKDVEAKLGPLEPKPKSPDLPSHDDDNKDKNKLPTETEPLIVKDGSKSPTKKEDLPTKKDDQPKPEPQPTNEMKSSTETLIKNEVQQEPPKPVDSTDSLVKVDENKDKKESSSSLKDEHSEPPLKKEEPMPKDLKEEEAKKLSVEEKGKPSDSKEEERTKSPKGEEVERSVKSSIEEKSGPLSNSKEEDNKKSPIDGIIKDSTKSPEKEKIEESTKSPKKENIEESSTKSPKKEKN